MSTEGLQPLTRRLAELLASDDGTLVLAQLQKLSLAANRQTVSRAPAGGLRIGIWDAVPGEDGSVEFARAGDAAGEWRYWADIERIPPRTGPRVVLLGESVARGYFFDPAVTFAGMLETELGVEVIDLARTDLTALELPALFEALPALEPDVVVLFAGNNWGSVVFELEELQRLADAVRDGGFARCHQTYLEEVIGTRARTTMNRIVEHVADLGVPLCVVVPPFNLGDWRSEGEVLAPILAEGVNARWLGVFALAQQSHDDAERARLAAELIELDGGTSAAAHELAAGALIALGRGDEARRHLEAARDAVCGLFVAHSPRCPTVVQDVLREAAAEHGLLLVDVPALFAADGRVPGRELLADYCHLTVDGMRAVVRATAAAVAPALRVQTRGDDLIVEPDDEAVGHVLAAIHNAHYGQRADVVRHHCDRALALSPATSRLLLDLLDLQSRRAEPWLCAAYDRVLASAPVRRYLGAAELIRSGRLADFVLSATMADALEAVGVAARGVLAAVHAAEADLGTVDLLEPRSRAATFRDRTGHSLGPERAYVRATAPVSAFHLVRSAAGPVRCRVTCRVAGGGDVDVAVNGRVATSVTATAKWSDHTFELAAEGGLNMIELRWPAPRPRSAELLEAAARRLERGVYPDALVTFGEVHAFTAE